MTAGRLLVIIPLAKGVIMAGLTAALDMPLVNSLIVAAVSALLSGGFLLAATIITVRSTRENRDILHDIKRKVGAAKRAEDD